MELGYILVVVIESYIVNLALMGFTINECKYVLICLKIVFLNQSCLVVLEYYLD